MKYEIKHRVSGQVLFACEGGSLREAVENAIKSKANLFKADLYRADLSGANLSGADLSRADLFKANLSGADLSRANLSEANLSGANLFKADLYRADLSRADLFKADLSGADLSRAKGLNRLLTTPLYMLRDQIGPIRAYKLVTAAGRGPTYPSIDYRVGECYEESEANADETVQCGRGLNVATLDRCLREWREGRRILLIEHTVEDIVAIPIGSDGKYRVRRLKVIREKTREELGLPAVEMAKETT